MPSINETLEKLSKSRFRSSFHLNTNDKEYIKEKGLETIKNHAYDFINEKIKPMNPLNDTKQTPYHGHPIFKAMHACACCCRHCLNKWYKVPLNTELSLEDTTKIVNLLMAWIDKELSI